MAWLSETNPVAATLVGMLDRVRVRREVPALSPEDRLDGRTALVTGAASGLGFATSVDLARRGARVLMVDRRNLPDAMQRATRMAGVHFEALEADLSDLECVARLAADLARRNERIDVLVLNASIVPTDARRTAQGFDEMFAVNYLASFALVGHLLRQRTIPAPGEGQESPRIIFVSSEAHRWSEDLALDDLARPRDPSVRRVLDYYGYYKLMLTTFAWELARRLGSKGSVFALCPGAMNTNIIREVPLLVRAPLRVAMRLFFQDPFAADEPVLHFACSRSLRGRTAVYLHKMAFKDVDRRASDPMNGELLWKKSEELLTPRSI